MIYLYIGLGILLITLIWIITVNNRFTHLLNKVKESSSGIDIALTKRYDMLTKLIDTVKGYTKHEEEVFTKVITLRQNMQASEQNEANKQMDESFEKINLLVEGYPELKASENFLNLQKAIIDVEEHLSAARRLHNSNISLYNIKVESFPSNIIAKAKGLTSKEYFAAKEEEKEISVNL